MAKIRILRVLEYEGEEEIVWNTMRNGGVPANGESPPSWAGGRDRNLIIRSGIIGFPEYREWKYDDSNEEVDKNG